MKKTAVVTGAGSGIGRAVAVVLAKDGWRVAIVGRRLDALKETAGQAGVSAECMPAYACDIGNADAVAELGKRVLADCGAVEALVNAAGTNQPQRSLKVLSRENYRLTIDTNLNGAYYVTQAFLPSMRASRAGTIVHISSEAGKVASSKAGAAYAMSKFGVAGLVQAINAEERDHGIRACAIFPGDVDTPLLDRRPHPPPAESRGRMLQAEDIAECVRLAVSLPPRAVIEELIIRPR